MTITNYIQKNTTGLRLNFHGLTRTQWSAMVLAAITGSVHLYLFWTQSFIPFLLAGLGFLTLAGLMGTTFDYRLLSLGGIPFTVLQIAAWIQMGMPDFMLGVADKTVQVALIGLLAYLFVSERRSTAAERTRTEIDTPEMKGVAR
ncbi:MAG TPA: hypothetical protein VFJ06_13515 [Halococcus sp.]|nr:hypothetical protein [Halococcus sp.]